MPAVAEFMRVTWQALNPREPKPSFLVSFFCFALVVFGVGLLLGTIT